MALNHSGLRDLFDAMRAAYVSREGVKRVLTFETGRFYDDLTPQGTLQSEYFNILMKANAQGWIDMLVEGMMKDPEQQDNVALQDVLRQTLAKLNSPEPVVPAIALPPARISSEAEAQADALDEKRQSALQREVDARNPEVDQVALLQRQMAMGCWTGALEVGGSHQGTCFLVAPDIVLTNHHVINPLKGLDGMMGLKVRFDFYKDQIGIIHDGFAVDLANDWLVLDRPPSAADESNDPNDAAGAEELDYALVRLAEPVGERPCPTALGQNLPRGFAKLDANAQLPDLGAYVTIIQHPSGAPRQSAFGRVLSYGPEQRRIRYDANTKKGSSGSAVLNGNGVLCALHHAGDPNFAQMAKYNQGIPIALIAADIAARGIDLGGPA